MSIEGECIRNNRRNTGKDTRRDTCFYKNKPYKNRRVQRPRSLEHLRTLKVSESHFLKKFVNKQLILLFIQNASNILGIFF